MYFSHDKFSYLVLCLASIEEGSNKEKASGLTSESNLIPNLLSLLVV